MATALTKKEARRADDLYWYVSKLRAENARRKVRITHRDTINTRASSYERRV